MLNWQNNRIFSSKIRLTVVAFTLKRLSRPEFVHKYSIEMAQANTTKEGLHSQCNIQMSVPGDVDTKCYGRLTLFQFPNAEMAPAAVAAVEVGSPAISCLCFCHFKRAPKAQLARLPLISPLFFLSLPPSLSLNRTSTDLTFPNLVGFFFFFLSFFLSFFFF